MEEKPIENQPQISNQPSHVPYWLVFIAGLFAAIILLLGGVMLGCVTVRPVWIETSADDEATTSAAIDETANWKTYSDTTYGFSFKYPSDLTLDYCGNEYCATTETVSGMRNLLVSLSDPKTVIQDTDAPYNGISVYIDLNPFEKGFDTTFMSDEMTSLFLGYRELTGEEPKNPLDQNVFFGTRSGRLLTGYSPNQGNYGYAYVSLDYLTRNKSVLMVSINQSTDDFKNIADQILSTFTFTNSTDTSRAHAQSYSAVLVLKDFMNAREARDQQKAELYLTQNAKTQYGTPPLSLIGTTSPRYSGYEMTGCSFLAGQSVQFEVKITESTSSNQAYGYFSETLEMTAVNGIYKVNSVVKGNYTTL